MIFREIVTRTCQQLQPWLNSMYKIKDILSSHSPVKSDSLFSHYEVIVIHEYSVPYQDDFSLSTLIYPFYKDDYPYMRADIILFSSCPIYFIYVIITCHTTSTSYLRHTDSLKIAPTTPTCEVY